MVAGPIIAIKEKRSQYQATGGGETEMLPAETTHGRSEDDRQHDQAQRSRKGQIHRAGQEDLPRETQLHPLVGNSQRSLRETRFNYHQ